MSLYTFSKLLLWGACLWLIGIAVWVWVTQ